MRPCCPGWGMVGLRGLYRGISAWGGSLLGGSLLGVSAGGSLLGVSAGRGISAQGGLCWDVLSTRRCPTFLSLGVMAESLTGCRCGG